MTPSEDNQECGVRDKDVEQVGPHDNNTSYLALRPPSLTVSPQTTNPKSFTFGNRPPPSTILNNHQALKKSPTGLRPDSPLRRHPLGDSHRADPSRLRADDVALPSLTLVDQVVQHELGHLRGLSATGLAAQYHYLIQGQVSEGKNSKGDVSGFTLASAVW